MVGIKLPRGIVVRASTLKGFSYQVKMGRHVQRTQVSHHPDIGCYYTVYCSAASAVWLADSYIQLR